MIKWIAQIIIPTIILFSSMNNLHVQANSAGQHEDSNLSMNQEAMSDFLWISKESTTEDLEIVKELTEQEEENKEKALENLKNSLMQEVSSLSEPVETVFNQKNDFQIIEEEELNVTEEREQEVATETEDIQTTMEQIDATEEAIDLDEIFDENDPVFRDFRQTFYSVTAGEVKVGYGVTYLDDDVTVIDNVMHYYDEEYEWLPIVAVNIDEVMAVGLDARGIPSYYGTILEITYPDGETQKAIVLDACGACRLDNRIDLWVYDHDYQHDVTGIEYRIIREGFNDEDDEEEI